VVISGGTRGNAVPIVKKSAGTHGNGVPERTGTRFPLLTRKPCWVAVARKPRDAASVLFGLKFADNIRYKFKSSQASKASLLSSRHTGAKRIERKTAILAHSRSRVLEPQKIHSFPADSKYSAEHSPLLRFPHLRWSRTRELAAALLVANCHKSKTWSCKRVRRTIPV